MLINDLEYFKRRANYCGATSGIDQTRQNNYSFNSWGFRGPEYEQHIGKPVNVCLGDSFTVNVGGPIEHSWCSQLALHFDIPTLNLGMDGAGNDAIRLVYNRACDLFDVQNTFVMYSFLHRRLVDDEFTQVVCSNEENFKFFKKQYINDAHKTAIANWCYSKEEQDFLKRHMIYMFKPEYYYADYKDLVDSNRKLYIIENNYKNLQSEDWPSYKQFCDGAEPHSDMYTKRFGCVLNDKYLSTNHDNHHYNKEVNKNYAHCFYNQWKQKNESQDTTQT